MNSRFPVLSTLSIVIRIVGIVLIVAGLYIAVAKPGSESHSMYSRYQYQSYFNQPDSMLYLAGGAVGVLAGLGAVVTSEVIGVLFAIEQNTRATSPNKA
jgi:hypothetical protein